MTLVRVKEKLDAPAKAVWDLLGDFGNVQKWAGPMVKRCDASGEGPGAERVLELEGTPGALTERLVAWDPEVRSLSYSIIGDSPLPLENYVATLRVHERGDKACEVDWYGTFDAAGVPEAEAEKMVEGIYRGALASVKSNLGA